MHSSSTPASAPSSVPEEQRVLLAAQGLLGGINRLARTLFRVGEFGLPRSYVTALDALDAGPRRVTELASFTGLTQPRVTVVLQELEERGLVERQRCAGDRRAIETRITPRGRELLARARQRMAAVLLDALRTHADDPEQTVAVAREAVRTLLDALEPEVH